MFTSESEFHVPPRPALGGPHLQVIEFTEADMANKMEKLDVRKSQGPNGVSNWVLKECSKQLSGKICAIIKRSLAEGVVPQDWKTTDIVPTYKNGKKDNPLNYRPVSLTSLVAKICEKIVKREWMKHHEEYEVISERQFGFRQGRSCLTNLVCFYSRVTDAVQERDGWVDTVYLDLKKAFDTVPHRRLMWKLETVGRLGEGPL